MIGSENAKSVATLTYTLVCLAKMEGTEGTGGVTINLYHEIDTSEDWENTVSGYMKYDAAT